MNTLTFNLREMININEELCNGCGTCITPCPDSAIILVDGKAQIRRNTNCYGAADCIPACPQNAITIVKPFDMPAIEKSIRKHEKIENYITQKCFNCEHTENDFPLVSIQLMGERTWVCTYCMPGIVKAMKKNKYNLPPKNISAEYIINACLFCDNTEDTAPVVPITYNKGIFCICLCCMPKLVRGTFMGLTPDRIKTTDSFIIGCCTD